MRTRSMDRDDKKKLEQSLKAFVGVEIGEPEIGMDPVNEAMIRHWCEAMGDENPVYLDAETAQDSAHGGLVAPPTMLQAWMLKGLPMADPESHADNKQGELHKLLSDHGYTSVVATNCEQSYARYLRPGDLLSSTTVIESISEEKATALGIGYFINTRETFRDQNQEEVGWQTFRVLKFKPHEQPPQAATAPDDGGGARPGRLGPPMGHDNAWWWEGVNRGELLIQRCSDCGELRHPPRPMCPHCRSVVFDSIEAACRGKVYSYVVLHHPKFPGYEYPVVCALIELEEGTRLVTNMVDCEPSAVTIGMEVELSIENVDEKLKLPLCRPAA